MDWKTCYYFYYYLIIDSLAGEEVRFVKVSLCHRVVATSMTLLRSMVSGFSKWRVKNMAHDAFTNNAMAFI